MAAPIVFFSTFLPGYGDVIALLVLQIFISLRTNVAWMVKVTEAIGREILPAVSWENVFRGEPDALATAGRAVLAATVFLCAAAVVFSPEGVRLWARLTPARRRRDPSRRSRPCSCGSCSPRSCCGS